MQTTCIDHGTHNYQLLTILLTASALVGCGLLRGLADMANLETEFQIERDSRNLAQ